VQYNYLFQELALMAGGYEAYERYEFAEFFPLHRSKQVMGTYTVCILIDNLIFFKDKLNAMMEEVAVLCDWPYYFKISWETQAA